MLNPFDHPLLIFLFSLALFWAAARFSAGTREKKQDLKEEIRTDLPFVMGATLTLLALIIGFVFSMAVSRYDQRKNYEADEANAIGTEYLRANLLPDPDTARVRQLLRSYLEQRILYYKSRNEKQVRKINAEVARLQNEMWSAVAASAAARPTSVTALILAGMNDVLNSQAYTQAAWWNRIPIQAWILVIAISIFCNLLVGSWAHGKGTILIVVLPIALSIALALIADIDSPRSGLIRVRPQNLESLAQSLPSQ